MNVSILMCEEWNPSRAWKTIGRKREGNGQLWKHGQCQIRRLCSVHFMKSQISNLEEFVGPKTTWGANYLLLTAAERGRRETDSQNNRMSGCHDTSNSKIKEVYKKKRYSVTLLTPNKQRAHTAGTEKHHWTHTKQNVIMLKVLVINKS